MKKTQGPDIKIGQFVYSADGGNNYTVVGENRLNWLILWSEHAERYIAAGPGSWTQLQDAQWLYRISKHKPLPDEYTLSAKVHLDAKKIRENGDIGRKVMALRDAGKLRRIEAILAEPSE